MREGCRAIVLCVAVIMTATILMSFVRTSPPQPAAAIEHKSISPPVRNTVVAHIPFLKGKQCRPAFMTDAEATSSGFKPLPRSIVEGVEKFVIFIGYQRSGHTNIGSVMDAHPNILISNSVSVLQQCTETPMGKAFFENKTLLINTIYKGSYLLAKCGLRSDIDTSMGYNLEIRGQWQGKFSQLRVVGEQRGGMTTLMVLTEEGAKCWKQFVDSLDIPLIAMHVVRNPYDMVATNTLYRQSKVIATKASDLIYGKLRPGFDVLMDETNRMFKQALSAQELSKTLPVILIHSEDYIRDPKSTVQKICKGLDLPCPQDYVEACYNKAYRTVSRSRDLIQWEPEIIDHIKIKMKEFPFFHGYTFEDSFFRP